MTNMLSGDMQLLAPMTYFLFPAMSKDMDTSVGEFVLPPRLTNVLICGLLFFDKPHDFLPIEHQHVPFLLHASSCNVTCPTNCVRPFAGQSFFCSLHEQIQSNNQSRIIDCNTNFMPLTKQNILLIKMWTRYSKEDRGWPCAIMTAVPI